MQIGRSIADEVVSRIDPEEIAALALDLGNIDSPPGEEGKVADCLCGWLERHGFPYRRLALLPHRPNIAATLAGTGGGHKLLFNSHMDTAAGRDDIWVYRSPRAPHFRSAWREDDVLCGNGLVNDKGPMAAWMIAAKAIKESGVLLKGDLILTMVSGEVGQDAVDEFEAPAFLSSDLGTRYLIAHGAVADYAIVAETTSFCPAWTEAGKARFKVTVYGERAYYNPYFPRPVSIEANPNALVQAARLIMRIEEWANEYTERHRYESAGGICLPKVTIGAIRGGSPPRCSRTPEVCSLYLDVRLNPHQDVLAVQAELEGMLKGLGQEGQVELFLFRRGYEGKNVEPLVDAIEQAHVREFGTRPGRPPAHVTSMWRDINPFNEVGIPAVTFGPGTGVGGGNFKIPVQSLAAAARLYALIAFDICNRVKPGRTMREKGLEEPVPQGRT